MNKRLVQLQSAFRFFCPDCGALNFVIPDKADLQDDEREEFYRELYDLEAWQELPDNCRYFDLYEVPEIVTCTVCGGVFEAVEGGE